MLIDKLFATPIMFMSSLHDTYVAMLLRNLLSVKKLFELKNKNAIVTGAAEGIGFAIAFCLTEFGANLVILARDVKIRRVKPKILSQGCEHRC